MESWRRSHHQSPILSSMAIKDLFVNAGMPITTIDSVNGVCLPVAISPQTTAKLHSQYWPPLLGCTLADVGKLNSSWHPAQREVKIEQNPSWCCSPTRTTASWPESALLVHNLHVTACWVMVCRCSCSFFRLTILQPVLWSLLLAFFFIPGTRFLAYLTL